jgi:hypothetical protein
VKFLVIGLQVTLFALFMTGSAHAQVTLITQPSRLPIQITYRGSYRLNSNLKVPNANTTAISVTSPGPVTIDLNGFTIFGPVTCGGSPITCAPSGSGVGISAGAQNIVKVFNGTITGFGGVGVSLGNLARVQDVSVIGNGGSGIVTGANSVVNESSASRNGGDGIATGTYSVISGCTVGANGGDGINGSSGVTVSASTSGGNKGVGILAETVTGSSADNNGDNGITAATVEASTAESNALTGVMAVTATGSTAQFNLTYGFGAGLMVNSSADDNMEYGLASPSEYAFDSFSGNTAGSIHGGASIQLGTSNCNGSTTCP